MEVQEYRRTCYECGKVWHVLASRESEIEKQALRNQLSGCVSYMGMASNFRSFFNTYAQVKRNEDAIKSEGYKLKTCPNCGSGNYEGVLVVYEVEE